MRIKSNIKLISLFPIILLMILASYITYSEYKNFLSLESVPKSLKKIEILDKLLTNITFERELAIKNLLSNSNEEEYKLNKQIKATNDQVKELVNLYNANKKDKLLYKIIEDIKHIVNKRASIKKKTISYDQLYSIYDTTSSDILLKISSYKADLPSKLSQKADSLIKSIELKKAVADERDFIARVFSKDADMDSIYMVKVFKNSNFYQTFLLLDSDIKRVVSNYLNNEQFFTTLKETNDIKRDILQKGYTSNYTLDEWYRLENQKIKDLQVVTNLIKKSIQNKAIFEGEIALAKMIASIIVLLLSIFMLYKYLRLKNFLFDKRYIKLLLQKSVDSSMVDKKIDLDTTEGVEEAYKLIDISLDKIELERQKAQNENASKSIFLANMSHEIRTPINGIVGFTDLLKKSNLNSEQREYIEIISKSTDSLLEIINNILDLSKIESKKVEIDSITFSPVEEFESAVELFIAKAAKKEINLSLFLDTHFQNYLIGDALKVKEVLLNLISNAIKFTPNGGEVNVRIKKLQSDDPQKERVYFEVTDNGIGMSQDELGEVFEAFTQADSTITRKYGGTGLGLTISSNYISILGGKLEVFSKKNEGTTFYFTLEFKKSQPLKIAQYKESFKDVTPLIITDKANIELAKFLKDYISFFTAKASYIEVDQVEQNISLFDRANLIMITKSLYDAHDFSYLKKTNKKLLIIEPTKFYMDKASENEYIYKLVEPISFFKTVEVLTSISPNKDATLLSYMQNQERKAKKEYSILVAEDNSINMKLVEKMLSQYKNLHLTKAKDGQEAIDACMKKRFDLILMDVAMPVVDGLSATKKIIEYHEINSLARPPIVALTANALKGDKEKFLSAGMDEYLSKPVKEVELLDLLAKFGISVSKEDVIASDTIQSDENIQNEDANLPHKDILIFKKSLVETKIFQKVLTPLYKEIDIVKDRDEFIDLLQKNRYQAILLDVDIDSLSIDELSSLKSKYSDSAFILFRNFETKVDNKYRAIFDEIVINSADKGYLEMILENYIKKEG